MTPEQIKRLLIPYSGTLDAVFKDYEDPEGVWTVLSVENVYNCSYENETLYPVLKPLEASCNGDMAKALNMAWIEVGRPGVHEVHTVRSFARAINLLRQWGYDCDDLIERDLAILHPNFDISDL